MDSSARQKKACASTSPCRSARDGKTVYVEQGTRISLRAGERCYGRADPEMHRRSSLISVAGAALFVLSDSLVTTKSGATAFGVRTAHSREAPAGRTCLTRRSVPVRTGCFTDPRCPPNLRQ